MIIDSEEVLKRYEKVTRSDDFIKYEKDFALKLNSGLAKGYANNKKELKLVKIIEEIVNELDSLNSPSNEFTVSTNSVFIHDQKSRVTFDYYNKPHPPRELGDLIFIVSVVFNGQKCFEKVTINQFKNERKPKEASWYLNKEAKEQLYLLSRFPTFERVSGIIPPGKHSLPNYSGCLGSYGLLHRPGDFVFISATTLDSFMGSSSTIKKGDLYPMGSVEDCLGRFRGNYPYSSNYLLWPPYPYFGNYHYASNTYDFAHKYLTLGIGESTIDNPQARAFLKGLMSAVKTYGKKKGMDKKEIEQVERLVDSFTKYGYVNDDNKGSEEKTEFEFGAGGLGIVHTVINLGKTPE